MADIVTYELRPPAAVITINRPDRRNALSRALVAALGDAFRRAADDAAVRAVILTGNGPAFCAGMDLDELRGTIEKKEEAELVWDDAARLAKLYDQIYTLPKPTVAAVNGAAVDAVVEQGVVDADRHVRERDAGADGERGLGIEVDEEHPFPEAVEPDPEVQGRRRLADSALLIDDRRNDRAGWGGGHGGGGAGRARTALGR